MGRLKGLLIKLENGYALLINNIIKAGSNNSDEFEYKLSKEKCDEIFGVVNIEKLADAYSDAWDSFTDDRFDAYKAGFEKAMELNKGKLFTENDILKAIEMYYGKDKIFIEIIQSLQQPTEIAVEVKVDICGDKVYEVPEIVLDKNGYLILRKI